MDDTTGADQARAVDAEMMQRCIALAHTARARGELPYTAVIARGHTFVCESPNLTRAERDATRHAELAAIALAQRTLGTVSLEGCTLYSLVEPCPMCAYAVRETRMARVVFGLASPIMGGESRYGVLGDHGLGRAMPEVFNRPPTIIAGFMQDEAARAMRAWNPMFWGVIRARGLLVPAASETAAGPRRVGLIERLGNSLRTSVVDRLWRT